MKRKRILIIGGGLAGLSSAVFIKNADDENQYDITILEASPKFGGRTYSYFDKNYDTFFDNGQHILAGWYKNTFNYLKTIGSSNLLNVQENLEINFIDISGETFVLKVPGVIAPFNIIFALWKYNAIRLTDKIKLIHVMRLINVEKFNDEYLLSVSADILLTRLKQSECIRKYFWNPFIYAVFNSPATKVSAKMFVEILKHGFSGRKTSNLIIPKTDLNKLFIDPALTYLSNRGVDLKPGSRVKRIVSENGYVSSVILENDEAVECDFIISGVPFFSFKRLFDEKEYPGNFKDSDMLRASSITSIHVFFNEPVPETMIPLNSLGMNGLIGTKIQWVFRRSNVHLSLIISGSDFIKLDSGDTITAEEKAHISNLAMKELALCFDGIEKLSLKGVKVIKEKRATFIPDNESYKYRVDASCNIGNLYVAGDWTNTGLPATIESAITSAYNISKFF
ncbi:MAG: FAD-dependent oxidoreductase [Ignavibacteriaceae bacterium]|nr:FAD-dependent oxidoreductase [Ignavibacteriaceae bacterium]